MGTKHDMRVYVIKNASEKTRSVAIVYMNMHSIT